MLFRQYAAPVIALFLCNTGIQASSPFERLEKAEITRGVCAVFGSLGKDGAATVVDLAKNNDLIVLYQSASTKEVMSVRQAAETAGVLNHSLFVEEGSCDSICLADNIADAVLVLPRARGSKGVPKKELLRILVPGGRAFTSSFFINRQIVKPFPAGIDDWSHPYHGPDNNPQSNDQLARHPYLTQFLGYPLFGCISEVTVTSGGRMFKAFGHIAFKTAHNEVLNKLYCINAYNGTILWTRPLKEGFMIHRNTMVATPDTLYLADDESCKLIDARTGKLRKEIISPANLPNGKVWKWMALRDDVLYALVGDEEVKTKLKKATTPGFGHWPWEMWDGYDYTAGEKAWGFGRHFIAVDTITGKVKWTHTEDDPVDSRGVCMGKDGSIFSCIPGKSLTCLDTKGNVKWKTEEPKLLEAIGENQKAQLWKTGFSTTTYIKCNDKYIFFAGPQRTNTVAVFCADGKMAWSKEPGNYQLVLRDDAIYAAGEQSVISHKLDYDTGKVIGEFSARRACTRATGSLDSIYYRAHGGTIRFVPATDAIEHIAPMRPPCQSGVIISNGMLYWGPWICGCNISLYGNIGLASAGQFHFGAIPSEAERLESEAGNPVDVRTLEGEIKTDGRSTTCGGMIFTATESGTVKAVNEKDNSFAWRKYTGGGINFAPAIWNGRVYVGSNDGWIYAYEAVTGRFLWRFRAAPAERRIPVYGKLMSTWPVAGGVVVADGVVYAAAGIAHYDETHVYALDAVTGRMKWHNGSSGSISEFKNGVSLQGQLSIKDNKLTFCGGNVYPEACYDMATGKCLMQPKEPKGFKESTFYEVQSYLKKVENAKHE